MNHNIAVIVLALEVTKGLKSYNTRGGFKNPDNIWARNCQTIKEQLPDSDICFITTNNSPLLVHVPQCARTVYVEDNQLASSLCIALSHNNKQAVLLTYNNVVFNPASIAHITSNRFHSNIVFDSNRKVDKSIVAGIVEDGSVCSLTYGLEPRNTKILPWGHMTYYTRRELALLKDLCYRTHPYRRHYEEFELINDIIEIGGSFRAVHSKDIKLINLNKPKDIKKIKSIHESISCV